MVIYWHSKELNATAVYQKCCKHFGNDAVHYSTITDWIRKIKLGDDILTRKIGSGPSGDSTIDVQICFQLEQFPFHSIRTLSSTLKIPKSTIHDHLLKMGFVVKHLRFVPHTLNSIQKLNLVNLSKQLLKIIEQARHQSWQFFLTGDACSVASSWRKTFNSIQKNNLVAKKDVGSILSTLLRQFLQKLLIYTKKLIKVAQKENS